jgi:hypothetical protein
MKKGTTMKRFIALFLIFTLTHHCYSLLNNGSLIGEATETNDILRYRVRYTTDQVIYTTGGITVAYPFTFSASPMVNVSVDLSAGTLLPNTTYTPIITTNATGSVTITVLKIFDNGTSTTITDTPTGDNVVLNILAIGE